MPNLRKTVILGLLLILMTLAIKVYSTEKGIEYSHGGIIRADCSEKKIAIIFTGGNFGDGGQIIRKTLKNNKIPASFFFTGDFYRNPKFKSIIRGLDKDGHYLGPHSDKHLLYCDWSKRDSLLVTKDQFVEDLLANYSEMERLGIKSTQKRFFIPPYEWYNDSMAAWSNELGITLINFTPGTLSNTDYTIPSMRNYQSTEAIYNSIINYERKCPDGLNGFLLLIHIGTDPERTDKFYYRLDELIGHLRHKGYSFVRIDDLLSK